MPLSYEEACDALSSALVFGINPSLDGISRLCEALGRPQDCYEVIQVAGTNGKTSTARFVHAVVAAHGFRTGLYTSPALERVNERIELDGGPVDDAGFARAVSATIEAAERLSPGAQGTESGFTEFEIATAAALWLFRDRGIEVAVLEVGMGGRWDATSVATPAVSVITGVGLDHTAILGGTVEQIAAEKAAIIRSGSTAILGPGTRGVEGVLLAQAGRVAAVSVAVREVDEDSPVSEDSTVRYRIVSRPTTPTGSTVVDVAGIHGDYHQLAFRGPAFQAANIATAIATVEAFGARALDTDATRAALENVSVPGRFEIVGTVPPVVVDGAHNPQAAAVLAEAITDAWTDRAARPCVILGVLSDKDAEGIARALATVASEFVIIAPDTPRALSAADLESIVRRVSAVSVRSGGSLAEAIAACRRRCEHGVVITGSLATAGQARKALLDASATA